MELYAYAEMTTKLPTYVSRVVPVPARFAPTVFERWWHDGRRRSRAAPRERIALDGGALELEPGSWARPYRSSALVPYRSVRGEVRTRGTRPWPVELELVPWSDTHSSIGIRYVGRRARGRGLPRYHGLVTAVLHHLGDELVAASSSYSARVSADPFDAAA